MVMYDSGLGTDSGPVDKMLGGAFDTGMDKNIRDLYMFLALNNDGPDKKRAWTETNSTCSVILEGHTPCVHSPV